MPILSRRDFLKLAGAGAASLALAPLPPEDRPPPPWAYGRVAATYIGMYERPSFDTKRLKVLALDEVVALWETVVGDEKPAHNRVWYRVIGGYLHSSWVQPVERVRNPPVESAPADAFLAEVSVPFTDARFAPRLSAGLAYRLYYSTTHWIHSLYVDPAGQAWYKLYDDRKVTFYYAPAEDFRPVPAEELTPLSPNVSDKRIEVDLTHQRLTAFENGTAVLMARVATGIRTATDDYRTPTGQHIVSRKRPSRHMAGGDLAADDRFDLPGVPWVSYFTASGVSFHGTYWHNDFGRVRSHGCVNCTPQAAKWIYRWSLPAVPSGDGYEAGVGTPVIVYY